MAQDTIERTIKEYLAKNRKPSRLEDAIALTDEELCLYLSGALEGEALERVQLHLSRHRQDQELVLSLRTLLEEKGEERAPSALVRKAKALGSSAPANCPHCGKPVTPFKRPLSVQRRLNLLWLGAALTSFAGSFLVPHYFLQFLAAALLFGFKWAVEERGTRTQIMIYKALREEEGSAGRHRDLHQHAARL